MDPIGSVGFSAVLENEFSVDVSQLRHSSGWICSCLVILLSRIELKGLAGAEI